MSRHESESSQHDQQNVGSERLMVRVPAGSYTLTDEDGRSLAALAERPDSEIDFSDIPRLTDEEKEQAIRMVTQQRAQRLQRAS